MISALPSSLKEAKDPIILIDRVDQKVVDLNDRALSFLPSKEDRQGKDLKDLVVLDDPFPIIEDILEKNGSFHGKATFKANGSTDRFDLIVYPVFIEDQEFLAIRLRKKGGNHVQEPSFEELLVYLEEYVYHVNILEDGTKEPVYVSPGIERLFNLSPDEFLERSVSGELMDHYHPVDIPRVKKALEELKENGNSVTIQYRFKPEGEEDHIWVEERVHPKFDSDGVHVANFGVIREVTDRVTTENRSRERERQFKDLFDNSSELIYIQDKEGRFLDVNKAVLEKYGYQKEEMIGATPEKLSAPGRNNMDEVYSKVRRAFDGEEQTLDWWAITKDGEIFPKELTLRKGSYFGKDVIVATGRDISGRYKALDSLKRSEEKYRTIFERNLAGVFRTTANRRIISCNDAFAQMLDFSSKEEIIGSKVEDTYETSSDKGVFLDKVRESDGLTGHESEVILKNGKRKFFLENVTPVKDESGEIQFLDGTMIDITQLKEANKALQESERKFRLLFSEANDAIFIMDHETFIDCNEKTLELFDCNRDDIIGHPPYEFSPKHQPDGKPSKEKALELIKAAENGNSQTFYWKHFKKDGTPFDAEVNLNVFQLEGKDFIQAIVRDISERIESEEALKQSEERFKRLSNATKEGIVIHDQGRILEVNKAFEKMTGYSSEELVGMSSDKLAAPGYKEKVKQKIREGSKEPYEAVALRKDGSTFRAELLGDSIPFNDKRVRVVAIRDISERKKAEEALRESEERFKLLSEASFEGIVLSKEGKIIDCNDQFAKIFEYDSRDEIIGKELLDMADAGDRDRIARHLRETPDQMIEARASTREGKEIFIEARGEFLPYHGEEIRVSVINDITERKRVEKELRERERAMSTLLENLPGMAYRCFNDPHWTMEFVSEGCRDLMGYEPEELKKNHSISFGDLILEEDKERVWDIVQDQIRNNNSFDIQYRVRTKDGSIKVLWEKGESVGVDEDSGKEILEGFVTDISKRVEYEEELKKSRERYRELIENSPYGTLLHRDGEVIYINEKGKEILGIEDLNQAPSRNIFNYLLSEFHETADKRMKDLKEGKEVPFTEIQAALPSGETIDLETKSIITEFQGERVYQVAFNDISTQKLLEKEKMRAQIAEEYNKQLEKEIEEHKSTQKKLKDSQEFTRNIIDSSLDMIIATDEDSRITVFNKAAEQQFRCSADEIQGTSPLFLYKDKTEYEKVHAALKKDGEFIGEIKNKDMEGNEFTTYLSASYLTDHFGRYIGTMGISRDITDIKEAENELRKSEEKYRAIYDQAYIGIAQVDLQGNFLNANQQFCEIIGYSEEEIRNFNFTDLTVKEDLERSEEIRANLVRKKNRKVSFEKQYFHKNGSKVDLNITVSLVTDPNDEPDYFVTVFEDITARKKAEEEIIKSLKEKEVLLKEVHHRVKNNLQVISSILNLQSSFVKDKNTLDILRESQNRISSMSFIHESLYKTNELHSIDFSDYVKDLTQNLMRSYRKQDQNIELVHDLEHIQLGLDQAIPCGLIINELVSNALKYAFDERENGKVEVCVNEVDKEGVKEIRIKIKDDGKGLPEGYQVGESDSLGLQLVSSLIEQLRGNIQLVRKKGTEYLITFEKE